MQCSERWRAARLQRHEVSMSGVIVSPAVRDLEGLADQLKDWLASRMRGATNIQLRNLSYPFGAGQSHETILFDLDWVESDAPRTRGCVVRIKPTKHTVYPDDLFVEQYHVMRALHRHGQVRVAEPLWFESDTTILGAEFFMMQKVLGRVAVSHPPYAQQGWVVEASPAQRAKVWDSGVRQLAAIQRTPLASVEFLRGLAAAADGLAQEWEKYERFLKWISTERRWPSIEGALDRLQRQWPNNQPAGLVWGDARLGNMMFDHDFNVVAVMDWEQPSLGGALHDLAWWLELSQMMHCESNGKPQLAGFGTRLETIALWHEVTGISTVDLEWYEAFTKLKIAMLEVRVCALRGYPPPQDDALGKRLLG